MADRIGGLWGGLYFFSLVATRFTEFSTERAVLFTLLGLGFLSLSVLAQLRPGAYGRFRAWVILAVKLAAVLLHVDGKRLCHTQVRYRGAQACGRGGPTAWGRRLIAVVGGSSMSASPLCQTGHRCV